jgi:3-oxoacyl-[acyl-carrier protein] reductase
MIAVVTGGTRGIGFGIAECLLKRGCSVAMTYRENETAAQRARLRLGSLLRTDEGMLMMKGDAGDPTVVAEQYRQLRDKLGPVDVLVNNAGIMPKKSIEEISAGEWDETIRINLSSVFYWSSQVIPEMKARKFGRIVNIASIAARGGGVIGPHYAASKAGILGFTKYAARELSQFGITVNAIAPGFIEDAGPFVEWAPTEKASLLERVLVSRLGQVKDVVRAFEYLLDSPFVTGVTLDVNGGAFMT